MSEVQDDQEQGQGQQPEPADEIPAGLYDARGIEGSEQVGEADTGTEQVVIDLELIDLKRQVSSILYFSEGAAPHSLNRLKALGWEGGDTFAGISKNVVKATVKYETYQGKRRMKVEVFTGQGRLVIQQYDDEKKRGFFAKLNELAAREKAGTPAAAGGYPKEWDTKGPAAPASKPVVNLG